MMTQIEVQNDFPMTLGVVVASMVMMVVVVVAAVKAGMNKLGKIHQLQRTPYALDIETRIATSHNPIKTLQNLKQSFDLISGPWIPKPADSLALQRTRRGGPCRAWESCLFL